MMNPYVLCRASSLSGSGRFGPPTKYMSRSPSRAPSPEPNAGEKLQTEDTRVPAQQDRLLHDGFLHDDSHLSSLPLGGEWETAFSKTDGEFFEDIFFYSYWCSNTPGIHYREEEIGKHRGAVES